MGQQLGGKSTVSGSAGGAEVTLPSRFGQWANFDFAVEESQGCRLREARACHKRPQALIVRIGGMCIISVHAHHSTEALNGVSKHCLERALIHVHIALGTVNARVPQEMRNGLHVPRDFQHLARERAAPRVS